MLPIASSPGLVQSMLPTNALAHSCAHITPKALHAVAHRVIKKYSSRVPNGAGAGESAGRALRPAAFSTARFQGPARVSAYLLASEQYIIPWTW
jgi:hypothetical protein